MDGLEDDLDDNDTSKNNHKSDISDSISNKSKEHKNSDINREDSESTPKNKNKNFGIDLMLI